MKVETARSLTNSLPVDAEFAPEMISDVLSATGHRPRKGPNSDIRWIRWSLPTTAGSMRRTRI